MKEETKCYCGHTTTCDCGPEEIIDKLAENYLLSSVERNQYGDELSFIDGFKLKQEQIENFCNKRIKELAIAKTKFIEHELNDWIEIADYKIAALKEVLSNCLGVSDNKLDVETQEKVLELMRLSYEAGFKQADLVEAGLEGKETEETVRWIYLKHKL